ncbi:hypothetical protein [Benzoatithermus flavus]|uniref:Uncharacterized protein n=1 Tax=Benzoatithermus flavus TaxID=3108223 RepID=A0ABU8XTA0_9PROT
MDDGTGGAALNIVIVLGTIILAVILIYGTMHYRKRGRGPTAPRSHEHPPTGARTISDTDASQSSKQ